MKNNIIFFGSDINAKNLLEKLVNSNFNICLTITKSEKKTGREKKQNPVKLFCVEKNINFLEIDKIEKNHIKIIKSHNPDVGILLAYGVLIPQNVIDLFTYGIINIHPSMLPKYRGSSPIQSALLNGDSETGVSVMLLSKKMDAGPIIAQQKLKIEKSDNYSDLSKKLFNLGIELLLQNLEKYLKQEIIPTPQNEEQKTITKMIEKSDGLINWETNAKDIFNKIRAFELWPGAYTKFNGKILKIIEADFEEKITENKIGKVFIESDKVFIQCKNSVLELKKVQLEGKSSCDIKSFINGYRNFVGSIL
ncbi:MAG TPA: methionyl-tRNA formyltransferase [bacterium]|jgi:methionyl-tRNA formyltransferase|nr:methionyl-tRNA formyltransferase [bacterium]HOG37920.1 methionyl-tRNA formyltransferase [bacterium]HQI02978.1 methionyl-tRNA formyltransferase [bacterium]